MNIFIPKTVSIETLKSDASFDHLCNFCRNYPKVKVPALNSLLQVTNKNKRKENILGK